MISRRSSTSVLTIRVLASSVSLLWRRVRQVEAR
jgi:hypothetical protein